MKSIHLCAIGCTTLICLTAIELFALYLGIDGAVLSAVIGIFGVVAGAMGKTLYERSKPSTIEVVNE